MEMNREMGERSEWATTATLRARWPLPLKIGCLVIVVACGSGLFVLANTARLAIKSEEKLHALIMVSYLIEDYMRSHQDQWPGSWDDLRQLELNAGMYEWPREADEVISRVDVDFQVSTDQLDDPAFDVTTVIRPVGDYWYDPRIRLQTLQDYIESRREEGAFTSTD